MKAASSVRLAAMLTAFPFMAYAQSMHQFMPNNNLWKQDNLEVIPNVSQVDFNAVIDAGEKAYAASAAARGETLTINRLWDDSTVNANCRRKDNAVVLNMYGGLARREETTVEAFALVMCHELSHAYGGEPYKRPDTQVSAEGQADYMGAKECLGKVLEYIRTSDMGLLTSDNGSTQKICDLRFAQNSAEHLSCLRKFSAGFSLGKLLAVVTSKPIPQYNTPDPTTVAETILTYPENGQCRVDTYAAGFLNHTQPSCWFKNGEKFNPVTSN